MGAKSGMVRRGDRWEPMTGAGGRAYALKVKREVAEARLVYARSVGDARLVAQEEARLEQVARWERGES